MKTLQLSITVFLSLGTIFAATNLAFSQEMQPGQENIQFIPVVPTEKSSVTALIHVFSLDIYCTNYTIDHVLSGHDLVMNVKTKTIQGGKCPMPAESYVSRRQGIGQMGFGTYDVKIFIDRIQEAVTKLYVMQGQIKITATGKDTDKQGDGHIAREVRN